MSFQCQATWGNNLRSEPSRGEILRVSQCGTWNMYFQISLQWGILSAQTFWTRHLQVALMLNAKHLSEYLIIFSSDAPAPVSGIPSNLRYVLRIWSIYSWIFSKLFISRSASARLTTWSRWTTWCAWPRMTWPMPATGRWRGWWPLMVPCMAQSWWDESWPGSWCDVMWPHNVLSGVHLQHRLQGHHPAVSAQQEDLSRGHMGGLTA